MNKMPGLLGIVLLVTFMGNALASESTQKEGASQHAPQVGNCLLPGQIKKLGQAFTAVAPRRIVKTTEADCKQRGGEYTGSVESTSQHK